MTVPRAARRALHNARIGLALERHCSPDALSVGELTILETLAREAFLAGVDNENAKWTDPQSRVSAAPTRPPPRKPRS